MDNKNFSSVHEGENVLMDTKLYHNIPEDEKIELLDGSFIRGYKRHQDDGGEASVSEASSESESVSDNPLETKGNVTPRKVDEEDIFLKNAFFLLAHAREIKSDSRMFLARVPVISGLAYCGPFPIPTLGGYIEWWLNIPEAMMEIKGSRYLVWFLSGSPLTGMNKCSVVNEEGKFHTESLSHFGLLHSSFSKINSRYTQIRQHLQTYTLEETVNRLHRNQKTDDGTAQLQVDYCFMRSRYKKLQEDTKLLQNKFADLQAEHKDLTQKYKTAVIKLHEYTLRKLYADYLRNAAEAERERTILKERLAALLADRNAGKIPVEEYKRNARSLNNKLGMTGCGYALGIDDTLREKFGLSLTDLMDFFDREKHGRLFMDCTKDFV